MTRSLIACAVAATLTASPCRAAELPDEGFRGAPRSGALAGLYFRLPLDAPAEAERAPRAGLHLAMSRDLRSARSFSSHTEAGLVDLRFTPSGPAALYIAGQPTSGREAERLKAAGASKGRLDKIMIGAGVALGLVAGFFLVSSVAD
jgi:hypothetical protein